MSLQTSLDHLRLMAARQRAWMAEERAAMLEARELRRDEERRWLAEERRRIWLFGMVLGVVLFALPFIQSCIEEASAPADQPAAAAQPK